MGLKRWFLAAGAAGALALVGCMTSPSAYSPYSRERGYSTVSGRIANNTMGPDGRVDGFVLDNGTRVHVSPDLAMRISPIAAMGQRVEVRGWETRDGAGARTFEASELKNLDTNQTVTVSTAPAQPLAPAYGGSGSMTTAQGRVTSLGWIAGGQVNGLTLDNGQQIRFAPVPAGEIRAFAAPGQQVQVNGWQTSDPGGTRFIQANQLTNLQTRESLPLSGTTPAPVVPQPNF